MSDKNCVVMISHEQLVIVKTGDMVSIHYKSDGNSAIILDRKLYGCVVSIHGASQHYNGIGLSMGHIILTCLMDTTGKSEPGDSYPVNVKWDMLGIDRNIVVLANSK